MVKRQKKLLDFEITSDGVLIDRKNDIRLNRDELAKEQFQIFNYSFDGSTYKKRLLKEILDLELHLLEKLSSYKRRKLNVKYNDLVHKLIRIDK